MTLDQCYQKYQGQSVLVSADPSDRGQCVQWADIVLHEVYNQPVHYGNAIDWYNNPSELLQNFDRISAASGYPKKGDFVIWNQGVGSIYGHIDVCAEDGTPSGFKGYDSNWGGNKTVHAVQHNYNSVLGYLRPKGKEQDMATATAEDVNRIAIAMVDRPATQEDIATFTGKPVIEVIDAYDRTGERKVIRGKVTDYDHLAETANQQLAELQARLDVANAHSDQVTKDKLEQIKKIVEA